MSFQNIREGKHRPHVSNTDLGDAIPRRIRRPVRKQTATCRDNVCGRLGHGLERLLQPQVDGGNQSQVE